MTKDTYSNENQYDASSDNPSDTQRLTRSLLQLAACGVRLPESYITVLDGVLAPDPSHTAMNQVDEIIEGMDIQSSQRD